MIRIKLTSVMVDDQSKALEFYTSVLGFVVRRDIPMGDARWLTVATPDDPAGIELLLEAWPRRQGFSKPCSRLASRRPPSPWTTSKPNTNA